MRFSSRYLLHVLVPLLLAGVALATPAPPGTLRVQVDKQPTPGATSPSFQPIATPLVSAAGFTPLIDYPSSALVEGPSASAANLVSALQAAGYQARIALDLDAIHLRDHELDADTGIATPSFAATVVPLSGDTGIYLLSLRGYPKQEWLDTLRSLGITVLSPLPPSAYVVRGPRPVLSSLPATTTFVRGTFPMIPGMKTTPLDETIPPAGPYRRVFLEGYEDSTTGSLRDFLDAVSPSDSPVATIASAGPLVTYTAALSDFEIEQLALSEQIFALADAPTGTPSSERQGMLIAQPLYVGAQITLPTTNTTNGYFEGFLSGKCFSGSCINNFTNTKVAFLDTGFNAVAFPTHADFPSPGVIIADPISHIAFNQTNEPNEDEVTHGTGVASIIGGHVPWNTRSDSGKYRYGEGMAPGVQLAADKIFAASGLTTAYPSCIVNGVLDMVCQLNNAFTALGNWKPDVINQSWNSGSNVRKDTTCTYDAVAQLVDKDTRLSKRLHVISAGNSTSDVTTCPYVRSPALGRNVLAVGATESFTPTTTGWQNNTGGGRVLDCAWNNPSSPQDARHMPSFSGIGRGAGQAIKPDLVAPAARVTFPVSQANYQAYSLHGVFCNESIDGTSYSGGGVQYGFSIATSFAAPVASGASAVVRKWYHLITGLDPSPAMTKALLILSARDIAGGKVHDTVCTTNCPTIANIPDIHQGWGMLSFDRLLQPATNYVLADQATILTPTSTGNAGGHIVDGSKETRIVLAWTDPYKTTTGSTPPLVNSIYMTAVDEPSSGSFWYGNNFNGFGQSTRNPSPPVIDTVNKDRKSTRLNSSHTS